MRLSDAIMLGSTLIKGKRHGYYGSERPVPEGCVLDMAAVAVGEGIRGHDNLARHWPWIKSEHEMCIANMYDRGQTLEKICAYADSIEPLGEQVPAVEPQITKETQACQIGS